MAVRQAVGVGSPMTVMQGVEVDYLLAIVSWTEEWEEQEIISDIGCKANTKKERVLLDFVLRQVVAQV